MTASYYFASACYIFLFHNLRIFQNLFFFLLFSFLNKRYEYVHNSREKNEERSCRSDRDIDSPIRALNLNKKTKKKNQPKTNITVHS